MHCVIISRTFGTPSINGYDVPKRDGFEEDGTLNGSACQIIPPKPGMDPGYTEELIRQRKPRDLALGLEYSHPFIIRLVSLTNICLSFPHTTSRTVVMNSFFLHLIAWPTCTRPKAGCLYVWSCWCCKITNRYAEGNSLTPVHGDDDLSSGWNTETSKIWTGASSMVSRHPEEEAGGYLHM